MSRKRKPPKNKDKINDKRHRRNRFESSIKTPPNLGKAAKERGEETEELVRDHLIELVRSREILGFEQSEPNSEKDFKGIDFELFINETLVMNLQVKSCQKSVNRFRKSAKAKENSIHCIDGRAEPERIFKFLRKKIAQTIVRNLERSLEISPKDEDLKNGTKLH